MLFGLQGNFLLQCRKGHPRILVYYTLMKNTYKKGKRAAGSNNESKQRKMFSL